MTKPHNFALAAALAAACAALAPAPAAAKTRSCSASAWMGVLVPVPMRGQTVNREATGQLLKAVREGRAVRAKKARARACAKAYESVRSTLRHTYLHSKSATDRKACEIARPWVRRHAARLRPSGAYSVTIVSYRIQYGDGKSEYFNYVPRNVSCTLGS